MYVDKARTIGEKTSILAGRMMESLKRAEGVSGEASLDLRFSLPVSFRSFAALRSRRRGAYVSRRKKKADIVIAPA